MTFEDQVDEAEDLVRSVQFGSTSMLQSRLGFGFAQAWAVMKELEARGVVGPADGAKARSVLLSPTEDAARRDLETLMGQVAGYSTERQAEAVWGWMEAQGFRDQSGEVGRVRPIVPTDAALWDFADELLDAWNIEDTNAPSLSEDFRDRFVERFGRADEVLIDDALVLAGKGVQVDDGHSYLVPARDLARYSETIKALVDHYASAWTVDGAKATLNRADKQ